MLSLACGSCCDLAQRSALLGGLVGRCGQVFGAFGDGLEAGVFTHRHQQLQHWRVGRGQAGNLIGAFTGIVERLQANLADRLTPVVGVVTKIQLLERHHQTAQVHTADTAAFTQHPVITQDIADQSGALDRKVLLVTLLGIETGDGIAGTVKQLTL
ncbi:hypothetical protein D3C77_525990 [compost metagenome]